MRDDMCMAGVQEHQEWTISSLAGSPKSCDNGVPGALFGELYIELHRLARCELARAGGPAKLGVTTLLHEAYLSLAKGNDRSFPDRGRFIGYAARVMRGLIIDNARSRQAQKRGGQFDMTALDDEIADSGIAPELLQVGDALDELARIDPALVDIVDLKFFCGFTFAEIAAMQSVSERTVQRMWEKARLYLHRSIRTDQ